MKKCIQCEKPLVHDSKSRRQVLYCSIQCQIDRRYDQYIKRWLDGKENGRKGYSQVSSHVRRWLLEQRGELCWTCGWKEQHPADGRVPVEVDHIDGNAENTVPSNLRLLCPNCHSLTDTYKARNRGNGRYQRRERYQAGKSY